MVVLNDFVLLLIQESGSRAQGSKARSLEGLRDEKGIQQSVAHEVEGKGIFQNFFKFRKCS